MVHQENEPIVTYQNNLLLSSPTLLFANGDGTPDIIGRRRFSLKLSDFDLGSKQRFLVGVHHLWSFFKLNIPLPSLHLHIFLEILIMFSPSIFQPPYPGSGQNAEIFPVSDPCLVSFVTLVIMYFIYSLLGYEPCYLFLWEESVFEVEKAFSKHLREWVREFTCSSIYV